MNTSTKTFFLICTVALALACAQSKKPLAIIPLEMLNYTDTITDRGVMIHNRSDFYLVQGYIDNKKTRNYIDSFVARNTDKSMQQNSHYSMIFYKESRQTNTTNILANPKEIDRYSQNHDQIYIYSWSNGKFETRYKVKKGKFVEPKSKIKVTDVPGQ